MAAEAVRTFASIVEKGAATAKAFGAFATFVKEGTEREGAFADFEAGQAGRRAVPGGAGTPGREGRPDSRGKQSFGLRGRRRPPLFGPVRYFRTRKESFSPVDNG